MTVDTRSDSIRAYDARLAESVMFRNMNRARYERIGYGGEVLTNNQPRRMSSKFAGTCTRCGARFPAGTEIRWSKESGAYHFGECPPVQTVANTETGIAADRADALLDEYDALKADQERKAAAIRQPAAAIMTRKAIYRVSLTGGIKQYGTDVVNVALIPNAKYGSVKVGEYRGESIGVVKADGSFMYWNTVDQNDSRVKAIRAAADVILSASDPIEYAKAFAVESASCMRCGDDLVDETSMSRLLGPTCFKKWDA